MSTVTGEIVLYRDGFIIKAARFNNKYKRAKIMNEWITEVDRLENAVGYEYQIGIIIHHSRQRHELKKYRSLQDDY